MLHSTVPERKNGGERRGTEERGEGGRADAGAALFVLWANDFATMGEAFHGHLLVSPSLLHHPSPNCRHVLVALGWAELRYLV